MADIFELAVDEISLVADKICELLHLRNIVFLKGALGAGKTTLVKEVCKKLNFIDNVDSPSFSIINEYGNEINKMYHVDLYRLSSIDEFWSIGGTDYIDGDFPCFIEWPDLIEDFIEPNRVLKIEIQHQLEEGKRKYILEY